MVPKLSFNTKVLIGFVAAVIIITVINIVGLSTISSMDGVNRWVAHTDEVIDQTQKIIVSIDEIDDYTNQYKLSGNKAQLEDFPAAIDSILPMTQHLRLLVSDNPNQVSNVDSLTKYVHFELAQAKIAIGHTRTQALSHLAIANKTNRQYCRQIGHMIISGEYRLLAQRRQVIREKIKIASWTMLLSTTVVVLLLLGLFVFISKTFIANQKLKGQLQVSESIFSGAFNYFGTGMALVSLKGQWMNVNPYLLHLLGYTEAELLSRNFQSITHPDDLDADLLLVDRILAGEIDTYKLEKRFFHKEGHAIWTMLTVSLVRRETGAPRFFVSQIEDITATKELIKKLELKNEVLSETSSELQVKIRQLEDFNGMVAHNLRGPAGSIEMMLSMIIDEHDADEKGKMLDLVYDSSKSLNATLKDLMEILEIRLNKSIKYADCNLSEITKTITGMLQGEILTAKAKIITYFAAPVIRFPKVYLESIFYNMVSNSLKYKREGEPVIVRISSILENGNIKLIFSDNGLGIDLERHGKNMFKLNKVFHQGYDSRGVGLFITKSQLEAHGGSVNVESTPGKGTEFTIYIPADKINSSLPFSIESSFT